MIILLVLSLLSLSLYAESVGVDDFDSQWEQFKVNFDRKYSSVEEEEQRKFNFLKNIQFIESHNNLYEKGEVSHEVGVNQFSDLSSEEYEARLRPTPPLNRNNTLFVAERPDPVVFASLPATFDWRSQNKVSAVKNQGSECGSCWAFATTGIVEAAYLVHQSKSVSLSEQQLIDCNTNGNGGCNGGWVPVALEYIQKSGIETESDYPYAAKNQACKMTASKSTLKVTGYKELAHPTTDEAIMTAVMNNGPLAVNIDASGNDFGYYKSGILNTGSKNLNHYVIVVGWGSNYWIVKNSWGTSWGQGGYAQMAKGVDIRGFNEHLFYPTI